MGRVGGVAQPTQTGSSPSVEVMPDGQQRVFWLANGGGGIWQAIYDNRRWSGPYQVPGVANAAAAPTVVYNPARGEELVFYKGTDGNLWETFYAGGRWNGPYNLGMGILG